MTSITSYVLAHGHHHATPDQDKGIIPGTQDLEYYSFHFIVKYLVYWTYLSTVKTALFLDQISDHLSYSM